LSTARVRGQEAAVYLGRTGVDAGLVDAVMSPAEAFAALAKLAGAPKSPASSGGVRMPPLEEMRGQRPARATSTANFRRLRRLGIFPGMAS
jgi:ClpP class serine protease